MGLLRHIVRDVMKPVLVDVSDRWWSRSPIVLKVEYTDTQFAFKFKAPATSTLDIYDGDGTMTQVVGQDDTLVTHTTNYATSGTYYFYVEGDYLDITYIDLSSQSVVSGDITRWSELLNLNYVRVFSNINIVGNLNRWNVLSFLTYVAVQNTSVVLDVETWVGMTQITTLNIFGNSPTVTGDIGLLTGMTWDLLGVRKNPGASFDTVAGWNFDGVSKIFNAQDMQWDSNTVDNALIALATTPVSGVNILLHGENAFRTAASDVAKATLLAASNTVTVNE